MAAFLSFLFISYASGSPLARADTGSCAFQIRESLCAIAGGDCHRPNAEAPLAKEEAVRAVPTPPLLLVQNTTSTLLVREQRDELIKNLMNTPDSRLLGDRRFVTVVSPKGDHWMGQIVDYSVTSGRVKPIILFRNGNRLPYDLKVQTIYSSSESLAAWQKARTDFEIKLKNKTMNGDDSYIQYKHPETGQYISAKVIGYQGLGDAHFPKVIFKDGNQKILDPSNLKTAVLGGNVDFKTAFQDPVWTSSTDGAILNKHVRSLPKRIRPLSKNEDALVEGADQLRVESINKTPKKDAVSANPNTIGTEVTLRDAQGKYSGHEFGESGSAPKLKKLGANLKKTRQVRLFYSKEYNTKKKFSGAFIPEIKIGDFGSFEIKRTRAISLHDLALKDELGDTGVHELGHMQTADNLTHNIQDPLAVSYNAATIDGKAVNLPSLVGPADLYPTFSQGDEVRQHAFNFWNATHQRVASEVIGEFRAREAVKVFEAFGVNRVNFFEAMDEATSRIEIIRTLNFRGKTLNHLGLEKASQPKSILLYSDYKSVLLKTDLGNLKIPLTKTLQETLSIEVKAFGSKRKVYLEDIPQTKKQILTYVESMLKHGNQLYDAQKSTLDTAAEIITQLKMSPDEPIDLETFLHLQDKLGRVKTSVNLERRMGKRKVK